MYLHFRILFASREFGFWWHELLFSMRVCEMGIFRHFRIARLARNHQTTGPCSTLLIAWWRSFTSGEKVHGDAKSWTNISGACRVVLGAKIACGRMLQFDKCWTTKSETIWFCISNIGIIFFLCHPLWIIGFPSYFFGKSDPFILGLMDFPWENKGCFVETALKKQGIGMCSPFFGRGVLNVTFFNGLKLWQSTWFLWCLRGWNEFCCGRRRCNVCWPLRKAKGQICSEKTEFFREVLGGKLVVKTWTCVTGTWMEDPPSSRFQSWLVSAWVLTILLNRRILWRWRFTHCDGYVFSWFK